jgi:hypothetical protein
VHAKGCVLGERTAGTSISPGRWLAPLAWCRCAPRHVRGPYCGGSCPSKGDSTRSTAASAALSPGSERDRSSAAASRVKDEPEVAGPRALPAFLPRSAVAPASTPSLRCLRWPSLRERRVYRIGHAHRAAVLAALHAGRGLRSFQRRRGPSNRDASCPTARPPTGDPAHR